MYNVGIFIRGETEAARSFLQGLVAGAAEKRAWTYSLYDLDIEKLTKDVLKKLNVDGIIIGDVSRIREILQLGIPTVVLSCWKKHSGAYNIVFRDAEIANIAVDHFLSRGYKNFTFFGSENAYWSMERYNFFCKRLKDENVDTHSPLLLYIDPGQSWRWYLETERLSEIVAWLKNLPKPLALMACDDLFAVAAINACVVAGLKVPDEVAVLGVNNDPLLCNMRELKLSSIHLDYEGAGYKTAVLMDQLLSKRKKVAPCEIVIKPTHIVTRGSTDVLATDDPMVLEAVRFIRLNSTSPIYISDVANSLLVSRRTLERRFKKVVNRSINDVIVSKRIDIAVQMLEQTRLSVKKIAAALGYSKAVNFDRVFKKFKGVSPTDYRKAYVGRLNY